MARLECRLRLWESHAWLPGAGLAQKDYRFRTENLKGEGYFLPHKLLSARTKNKHSEKMGRKGVLIPQNYYPSFRINRRQQILLRLCLHKMIWCIRYIYCLVLCGHLNNWHWSDFPFLRNVIKILAWKQATSTQGPSNRTLRYVANTQNYIISFHRDTNACLAWKA